MSDDFDVIVLGSGSAAMTAALRAAQGGLRVLVVEKSAYLGGTSAMSGAGTWVPGNHIARRYGLEDSFEDIITYIRSASPDGWADDEDELWQSFAEAAPRMLSFIEAHSPLRFKLVAEPDPFSEKPGGKSSGRMLTPYPLSRRLLGRYSNRLRKSTLVHLFDYEEMVTFDPYHHPVKAGLRLLPKLAWRWLTRSGGQGTALMVGLIRGGMDAGSEFLLGARARRLAQDSTGRVIGVVVETNGRQQTIPATKGVILATGGFEWNRNLLGKHFPGPTDRLGSPSSNEGDGQVMAAEAGAKLDRMDQANIYPCLPTRYEGQPCGLPMTFQAEPYSIVVNGKGERFVSENDFNIGEAIDRRDPVTGEPIHLPVWLIGDVRFLSRSIPFRWYASYETDWIKRADTIEALADKIGLPSAALQATVDRFNRFCDEGSDEDFGRGETVWEGYKSHGVKNKLKRIEKAPFVAMSVNRSILGTKGGARTNAAGQVLRPDGSVIDGLYAAGLAMANPIGTRALGPGTTIGPNMTWGYICAESLLGISPSHRARGHTQTSRGERTER